MMKFKILIGCLSFFLHLQAQLNATVYNVLNGQDAGANSLRSAIIAANANIGHDTINIANTVNMISLTSEGAQAGSMLDFVRDTLTIFGNGVILDAQVSARFITLVENSIIIDVTFQNASSLNAGAVYSSGNLSSFINCSFLNNTVLPNGSFSVGGAIYHANGHLAITNCEFTNNTASVGGGAIHTRQGILDIINCTFNNNTAGIRGQSINQIFGGIGQPSTINIYSCNINSGSSEPDIFFDDGQVVFHAGYTLLPGNKLWIEKRN